MRKTNFTKFLESLNEEELREELDKLYTKYKPIKEFYSMELGSDDDRKKLLDRTKKSIGKLYEKFRTRSRLSKVNNLLKEMASISIFDHELADVYIHHVETAVNHLNYYDWTKDADFNHLSNSFKKAVDLVTSSQSKDQFKPRFDDVIGQLHRFSWFVDDLEIYMDDNLI